MIQGFFACWGIAVSAMYNIEYDYRYLYVKNRKGGTVNTIEGNSGDKVARRSYRIGSSNIYGYGVPAY